MPNRTLNDRIIIRRHYHDSYTVTETPASGVDIADFHTVEVVIDVGPLTNTGGGEAWAFSLEHSDTINADFEAVVDAEVRLLTGNNDGLVTAGVFATATDAAGDETSYRCGYVGGKRYLRVVATAANTPGATPIAVLFLGEPRLAPGLDG